MGVANWDVEDSRDREAGIEGVAVNGEEGEGDRVS